MSRTAASRTARTRVAGITAAALLISCGGPAASAYWQTLGSNNGAAKADSILALAAPAATGSAGTASVGWVQGTTAGGRPVSGYTVARYASATGGIKVAATGGCADTVAALGCTEAGLPAGTWYYTVTPVLGAWAGTESARSAGVAAGDTTPPVKPTISAPALVTKATVAGVEVNLAAEANSLVTITVTDVPPAGALPKTVTKTLTATGSTQTVSLDLTILADSTVTYSAVATDAAGNASAPGTATSIKDATAPAVSAVTLDNGGSNNSIDPGDKVVLKFSEALDPSTICSNWSPTGGSQVVNGSEQVTVNVSTAEVLSVSVTSTGCGTARIGSVALDANYVGDQALSFSGTGGTGSAVSSLAWNASTFELTITLGKLTGAPNSEKNPGRHRYTPAAGLTDGVGNPLPTTTVTGANSKF